MPWAHKQSSFQWGSWSFWGPQEKLPSRQQLRVFHFLPLGPLLSLNDKTPVPGATDLSPSEAPPPP